MRSICVYLGSNPGRGDAYAAAVRELARTLVEQDLHVVYGGARVGTMGVLADEALAAGGRVTGVITRQLVDVEIAHRGLTALEVVGSMHERKARLAALADGFVTLPGGLGTLEEVFEMLTWSQLGLHEKPVGLLNTAGFHDRLLAFLDHAVTEQFLKPEHRALILEDADPATLLDQLRAWTPPATGKWIDPPAP